MSTSRPHVKKECRCTCQACNGVHNGGVPQHEHCQHLYPCPFSPHYAEYEKELISLREMKRKERAKILKICSDRKDPVARFSAAVQLMKADYWSDGAWFVARFVRSTRLFLKGDLVVGLWCNGGGERQPVWGVSGRGHIIRNYYVQYARFSGMETASSEQHYNKVPIEILELPRKLAKGSPASAALREFLASCP